MRSRAVAVALTGVLATVAAPARAALVGPAVAPPAGCSPTNMAAVAPSATQLCIHRVLVTETWSALEPGGPTQDQNATSFTFTDHETTLSGFVPNWWPSGGPQAGMVVTLWGHQQTDGRFAVDRWIELAHGTGPVPDGPYPRMRLLDVSSGKAPENRMVWVRATAFLLDPQDNGDGDIHVQTLETCPAAGLTTETTPPLRGYVDRPAINLGASASDTTDQPHDHLGDAPPVGVPVMVLGATRYDFGFGWWEIHPIRAWRYLTAAELLTQQAECAADPLPHLDQSGPVVAGQHVPIPFGVPPCTDGSEFGNAPGFSGCGPVCYVAHTAIDQPEQLAGPCANVTPIVTRSQERLPEADPGGGAGRAAGQQAPAHPDAGDAQSADGLPGAAEPTGERASEHVSRATVAQALARVYGHDCRALRHRSGRAFRTCLNALARLAGGEIRSPSKACRTLSRRHAAGRHSDFAECVAAGRRMLGALRAGARSADTRSTATGRRRRPAPGP